MSELSAFFQAYASGDGAALNKFLVRGAAVTGLVGAATFDPISALHVPPGGVSPMTWALDVWLVVRSSRF